MSKEDQHLLHLTNKVKQLEYLLEQERVKNFGLRRLLVELKFMAKPFLNKLEKI
jgi:hypothetical protein